MAASSAASAVAATSARPYISSRFTEVAKALLAEDWARVDTRVPHLLARLTERGAHQCWHKHGTFKQHLLGVWKILSLWEQPQTLARCGLYHSAYSNSYVNLAIFKAGVDRDLVQKDCGKEAEELIYKFCVVDRQKIIVDTLFPMERVPAEGLVVPHIHTGDSVHLSSKVLGQLLVMTMADVADQQYGWQDDLFGDAQWRPCQASNEDHEETKKSDSEVMHPFTLWPGISKPGLWMYFVSKLATLARTCPMPVRPPVFNEGQFLLDRTAERQARDLYWEVMSEDPRDKGKIDKSISRLTQALALNPFLAEPHTLLAQCHLVNGDFPRALLAAEKSIDLMLEWGTNWDKRVSFEAWMAWTRVLRQHAEDKTPWHSNAWGVINLGLVR
ncbi:Tetratricopeptide-like helical [Nannochloropsis gaditana]|uniref:Tetratricopeptide-like helical n=1 Tax=Nannochloropsis gaditana TaxID=72520 RepID=W7U323_9STRA|nr:Tetratricopeptide-like helical [Nannochloropsis gaditana]